MLPLGKARQIPSSAKERLVASSWSCRKKTRGRTSRRSCMTALGGDARDETGANLSTSGTEGKAARCSNGLLPQRDKRQPLLTGEAMRLVIASLALALAFVRAGAQVTQT